MADQKYIVIWNRALAQRKEWLVLGGARREATNRTGIFHTGAKKALVAFHLLGLEVIVASSDDRGDYFYSVDSKDTEIGSIVTGRYRTPAGAIEVVETTYTTAIADNAWLEGFTGNPCVRALGQFLLNAVGTSPDEWGILENQEEPEIVAGTTRVYVPQVPMVAEVINRLERYFTWGQIPIAEMPVKQDVGNPIIVQVLSRPDDFPAATVIYHTGLIAYCEGAMDRPYRYVYNILDDTKGEYLSEERHIRSIAKVRSLIIKAYEKAIHAGNVGAMECILDSLKDGEGKLAIWASHPLLGEMFFDRHGKRACMAAEDMVSLVADVVQRPVVGVASTGLVFSLENSGVDKATDTSNIKDGHVEEAIGKRRRSLVQRDVDLLMKAGLASGEPLEYHQFTNVDPSSSTAGTYDKRRHAIGIRSDVLDDPIRRLETLVHEHRHAITDTSDYGYKFTNRADSDLVRLLLALHDGRNLDEVADKGD